MSIELQTKELQNKLYGTLVNGAGFYAVNYIAKYLGLYTAKQLKQFNMPVIKIGLSVIADFLPIQTDMRYVKGWLDILGYDGVKDAVALFVEKTPVCYANSSTEIDCKNLDTVNVIVKIDGIDVASTDMTISGSAEDFTITLKNAMSTGNHDLMVAGAKKAFSGKIHV